MRILLFLLLVAASRATGQPQVLPVVPQPRLVEWATGQATLGPAPVFRTNGMTGEDHTLLREEVSKIQGLTSRARQKTGPQVEQIFCVLHSGDSSSGGEIPRQFPPADPRIGEEGYQLSIETRRIVISARTPRGLFYGLQTLKQLVRASPGGGNLPLVRIVDWPDFPRRAILDDISRGPVPHKEYFREQIRRLAELKINMVTYYTENVVRTRRHWEFAPAGGALTVDEWRDLVQFARKYHVTVVGNFQSFGHFQQILAHPRYAPLGESGSLLSPAREESYAFLRDIYEEMVPAFDAPFFCICADETFDLGKGASKRMVDSLGIGRVYAGHIQRIDTVLRHLGVRTMLWGDVALQHPEIIPLLPKNAVVATWTYDALGSYLQHIAPFTQAGLEVFVSPGVLNSSKSMPDYRVTGANIRGFVRDGKQLGAQGVLTCVWDDGGSAFFSRDWFGVALGADQAWYSSPGDTTFDRRYASGQYADHQGIFTAGLRKLREIGDLPPADGMAERVFWQNLIPARGEKGVIDPAGWDEIAEIALEAERTLQAVPRHGYGNDVDAFLLTASQYQLAADLRLGLLDAATTYRDACLLQRNDPPGARRALREAMAVVDSLRTRVTRCGTMYTELWLRENRPYALNRIMDRFTLQASQLRDVGSRLGMAQSLLESGEPLPPPGEVRLWIESSSGTYLGEWLVCGPIVGTDLGVDALASMGGESAASPAVTQEFRFGSGIYRWKRLAAPDQVRVEFPGDPRTGGVAYAYATIESPLPDTLDLRCGAGSGLAVFVNGIRTFSREGLGPFILDAEQFSVPLVRGTNHLLVKVFVPPEGTAFSLKVENAPLRGRKNRYRIAGAMEVRTPTGR